MGGERLVIGEPLIGEPIRGKAEALLAAFRARGVMLATAESCTGGLVAAALTGVTPTSYVASTAVAVARGEVRPMPSGVGDVVRELVEARAQLVRYGVLLNQAVARLNATGEVDGALGAAARRCDEATTAVRVATERLGRVR